MTNEALEHLRITIKNDWPWGISITPEDARSLVDEIDRLQARISDFEDDFRKVTSETCAPDEKHCSCVPHLRAEIQWLRVQADEREQRTNRIMLEAERHRKIADEAVERLSKLEEE